MILDQIISFYIIGKTGFFSFSRQFLRTKSANIWEQLCYISLKKMIGLFCCFSEFSATKQTKVKQKSQKQKDLAVPKMI
jgi:hypothetical protein